MTHVTLLASTGPDEESITCDLTVNQPGEKATIEVTSEGVQINTTEGLGEPVISPRPDIQTPVETLLELIDPANSEDALKVVNWLRQHGRLVKVGDLTTLGLGYMFVHQEPQGSSRAGYSIGQSVADRVVERVAEVQGEQPFNKRGMCRNCFRMVRQRDDDAPELETHAEGDDPILCPMAPSENFTGRHVL